MKQLIRFNTFETNSSSTHSLTLNKHSQIESLLEEALDIVQNIDQLDELYRVLGLLREAEYIILDNMNRGDYETDY